MTERSYNEIVAEEESKHDCCNGYVYYDGRCGDGPMYVHTETCRVGKREKREQDHWDNERR